MKLHLPFILIIIFVWGCEERKPIIPPVEVSTGKIERIDSFGSKYITPRNVDIWLPEGYSKKMKYAVVYMHDGQMLYDSTTTWNKQEWGVDEVLGKLIEENEVRETIVVGIWNGGKERHSDYFPQKPFEKLPEEFKDSLLHQAKRYGQASLFATRVQSDNYLKFIVEELKPYIDENYSTLKDQANTFVAGSSMGGLISMYAICEYPEIFGGAACLSTHWTGTFSNENNPIPQKFIAYLDDNIPDPYNHKLYFDYGTETLDSMYESFQLKADTVLMRKGYSKNNWITKKFPGEDHSENAWKNRLHIPFTFLLSKR